MMVMEKEKEEEDEFNPKDIIDFDEEEDEDDLEVNLILQKKVGKLPLIGPRSLQPSPMRTPISIIKQDLPEVNDDSKLRNNRLNLP